jgi:hypothetical protein
LRSLQKIQPDLWRRPRPKLGCGAKERNKDYKYALLKYSINNTGFVGLEMCPVEK